jgi:DNA polymerase-3 subunit delta'
MNGWPEAIADTPAVAVLDRALQRGRLAHGLLLHGDAFPVLEAAALALADRLLNPPGRPRFAPLQHPDCFTLRPAGKSRQIGADKTRELIGHIQRSPQVGARKVALVFEADRMHVAAANIFLKTLEEPPASTTILLLTTRPYALLTTIRSRCLHFRFPQAHTAPPHPALAAWCADYQAWLGRLVAGVADKRAACDHLFAAYGFIVRLEAILDEAVKPAVTTALAEQSAPLAAEEEDALEASIAVGVRQSLLTEIELATRAFVAARPDGESLRPAFIATVQKLETCAGLLRVNLSFTVALEEFFLTVLRLWARRPAGP